MKIAIIHTRLMRRGGLESRLFMYMDYLRQAGHDVSIIVFKVDNSIVLPKEVNLIQINLKHIPKLFRPFFFNKKLGAVVTPGKFDLVISLGRTTHQDAMIVAGNHKAFMAITGRRFKTVSDYLQIHLDNIAYHSPGTLFAASEMIQEQLLQYSNVLKRKIKILYPPTDSKRFYAGLSEQKNEFRKKYEFSPNKKTFLLVSSNHKLKGLAILEQVFRQLDSNKVELIVAGSQPVHSSLPHIRSIGFVKETEELYAAADYSVLPSAYDSFGQVVTESLLCGTPVIVSHLTGAKALINDSNGIIVDDLSPKKWLEAIHEALHRDFNVQPLEIKGKGIDLDDHMHELLACARNQD